MSKNYPYMRPTREFAMLLFASCQNFEKDFFQFFPLLHAWIFSWIFLRNNGCAGQKQIVGEIFVN